MTMAYFFEIFVLLQVADSATTVYILNKGGVERNPIMAKAMRLVGVLPALLIIKAIMLALVFAEQPIRDDITYLLVLIYVFVVGNNLNVIRNMRKTKE